MKIKISEKLVKVLIFIFFATVPLVLMLNLDKFDYYSAFDELQSATKIPRQHLEIMNYWRRGNDYVVKVRVYRTDLFKVKFVKHNESFKAEFGMIYDEGWKPLQDFLKSNNISREKYEPEDNITEK